MLFRLILKNAFRHTLRTGLTLMGIVIAVLSFGVLHTFVDAWYAGAKAASSTRLISRNAISLVFSLPTTYKARIRQVEGVHQVSMQSWFGGIYIDRKNFFPQFAIEPQTFFELYPEILVEPTDMKAFMVDRRGAMVGRKLAETYGWKVGDVIPIQGTIYPGNWNFVVRAIYNGAQKTTDESTFFFHWDYLNETVKQRYPRRGDSTGIFVVGINEPDRAAEISQAIDKVFRNSLAETLTETEQAFQLSFVAMAGAIVKIIRIVSLVVIAIILIVMANTMAMTARERMREYATLKALGFRPAFIAGLIYGESLAISCVGGIVAILLTYPIVAAFGQVLVKFFPIFILSQETVLLQCLATILVAVLSAIIPAHRAMRVGIADGLRSIG